MKTLQKQANDLPQLERLRLHMDSIMPQDWQLLVERDDTGQIRKLSAMTPTFDAEVSVLVSRLILNPDTCCKFSGSSFKPSELAHASQYMSNINTWLKASRDHSETKGG